MNGIYSSRPLNRESDASSTDSQLPYAWRWLFRLCDKACLLVAFLIDLFRQPEVRRCLRGVIITISLICFIGLIGGIDSGLISVGMGIVLGLLLLFVEILCLRP